MFVKHPLDAEKNAVLEDTLGRMANSLRQIEKDQIYFRAREYRNMATVENTEGRIFWGAMIGSLLVVLLAAGEVHMIRGFFASKRTGL